MFLASILLENPYLILVRHSVHSTSLALNLQQSHFRSRGTGWMTNPRHELKIPCVVFRGSGIWNKQAFSTLDVVAALRKLSTIVRHGRGSWYQGRNKMLDTIRG